MIRHGFGHFFVSLELLVFGRQRVTVHEQELGTVQTHAFGAVADGAFGILDGPDVGAHFDLVAIQVMAGRSLSLASSSFSAWNWAWNFLASFNWSAVGLMMTWLLIASSTSMSPFLTRSVMSLVPTTAGSSRSGP